MRKILFTLHDEAMKPAAWQCRRGTAAAVVPDADRFEPTILVLDRTVRRCCFIGQPHARCTASLESAAISKRLSTALSPAAVNNSPVPSVHFGLDTD